MTEHINLPMSRPEIRNMFASGMKNSGFIMIGDELDTSRARRAELRSWCVRNTHGRWFYYSEEIHVQTVEGDQLIAQSARRWFGWDNVKIGATYCFENKSEAMHFKLVWGGTLEVYA
ncbi:hypothetical protein D3C87_666510 [compost metagenome]